MSAAAVFQLSFFFRFPMSEKCKTCNLVISSRRPGVSCNGSCGGLYHIQCIDIPADIFASVSKYPSFAWRCESCCKHPFPWDPRYVEQMLDDKIKFAVSEIESKLEKLKDELVVMTANKCNQAINNSKSYSSVLKCEAAVIIKPRAQNQKNSATKADVLTNVNPVDNNINISRVKNTKDGGILIGCSDIEEISKFKNLAINKLNANYEIKDVKNLSPRIRIVGMSEKFEEHELVDYIKHQNKSLCSNSFECKLLKFWSTKRNKDIYQAVLQIDVVTYNNIMAAGRGKLFVGFDMCDVYDSIDIRRCYKCCGFNHTSVQCKSKECCPKCGGGHSVKDCTSNVLKCTNCDNYARIHKTEMNADHAAWDYDCFVYKQQVSDFKSRMLFSS